MAKAKQPAVPPVQAIMAASWRQEPAKHDYPAAGNYLGLIADPALVKQIIAGLQKQPVTQHRANDILRAANLNLLSLDDASVRRDLSKLIAGEQWAPVLLVRGDVQRGLPLTIADGYHRVCASYHLSEDTPVPCQMLDLPLQ